MTWNTYDRGKTERDALEIEVARQNALHEGELVYSDSQCSIRGCEEHCLVGGLDICPCCKMEYCPRHAALLLVIFEDKYVCHNCKIVIQDNIARFRASEEDAPTAPISVTEYKERMIALLADGMRRKAVYDHLYQKWEEAEEKYGEAHPKTVMLDKARESAYAAFRADSGIGWLFLETVRQWREDGHEDRIQEIMRWRKSEGKKYFAYPNGGHIRLPTP